MTTACIWSVSKTPKFPGNSTLLATDMTREEAIAYHDRLIADGWKSDCYRLTVWGRGKA